MPRQERHQAQKRQRIANLFDGISDGISDFQTQKTVHPCGFAQIIQVHLSVNLWIWPVILLASHNTENNPVRFNPVPSSPVPQSAANQILAPHPTRAVKAFNAGVQSI
jgi:hypothetical protein